MKALETLKKMTTEQLIAMFDATDAKIDAAYKAGDSDGAADIATVRGWIMDEIEARLGAEGFEAWLDGEGAAA